KVARLLQKLVHELLRSRIVSDTGWSFAIKVGYTASTFLTTVLLARLLDAEEYGIYAYGYAVANVLALLVQAGPSTLVMRETASSMAKNQVDLVKGVWRWAGAITGLTSLGLALAFGSVLFFLQGARLGAQGQT